MTRSRALLLLVACPLLHTAVMAAEPEASPAYRVVANLERAWNSGDGEAFAAEYWPNGELVNIFGSVVEGQAQISTRLGEILRGPFRASQVTARIRKITAIGEHAIIVDVDQDNTGLLDGAGREADRKPVRTRMKHILEKRDGVWKIVSSQNTQLVTPDF